MLFLIYAKFIFDAKMLKIMSIMKIMQSGTPE